MRLEDLALRHDGIRDISFRHGDAGLERDGVAFPN